MTMDTSILSEVEHPPSHFSLPNQKKDRIPSSQGPKRSSEKVSCWKWTRASCTLAELERFLDGLWNMRGSSSSWGYPRLPQERDGFFHGNSYLKWMICGCPMVPSWLRKPPCGKLVVSPASQIFCQETDVRAQIHEVSVETMHRAILAGFLQPIVHDAYSSLASHISMIMGF